MAETNISTSKVCTKCKIEKLFTDFNKDKSRKDGVFPWCRLCANAHLREQHHKHRDKRLAQKKIDYERDKEQYKDRATRWAQANPEKRKETTKRYRENNPETRFETQKRQREKNPGYYRAHYKMRQTRKRNALSTWADLEAIEAIYRQCSFVSRFTGIKHHVDHFYPLKSDVVCGLHNEFNLRIIPAAVNLSKGNRIPEEE